MRKFILVLAVIALLSMGGIAQAYEWNFTDASNYWSNNAVVTAAPTGGSAYVAPRTVNPLDPDDVLYGADNAAVFARVNTQAFHLKVGDVIGGGFTVSGMNHPDAVFGSLYLSPTGGGGSTVMINMSPMGRTGANGSFIYTFDLNTLADVKIQNGVDGSWGTAQTTGTFGGAINWVNSSVYNSTYVAFFGPQIGMSGTSETTFTVSKIGLNTAAVPEPMSIMLGIMGLGSVAGFKRLRRK